VDEHLYSYFYSSLKGVLARILSAFLLYPRAKHASFLTRGFAFQRSARRVKEMNLVAMYFEFNASLAWE